MPDNSDLFAAELAFGLLDANARSEAEWLRATDSQFAAAVAKWAVIAEAWLGELPEHQSSPDLLGRVAALIAPASAIGTGGAVQLGGLAQRRDWWRPLAIAACLLACLFAGLWLSRLGGLSMPRTANITGRFSVAQIGGVGESYLATVLYDRAAGTLTIRVAALAPDPAKAPELWLINGVRPPHSLGFGELGATIRMQAGAHLQRALIDGATLAITLEPMSTHPHAAPGSKILGTGTIRTL